MVVATSAAVPSAGTVVPSAIAESWAVTLGFPFDCNLDWEYMQEERLVKVTRLGRDSEAIEVDSIRWPTNKHQQT